MRCRLPMWEVQLVILLRRFTRSGKSLAFQTGQSLTFFVFLIRKVQCFCRAPSRQSTYTLPLPLPIPCEQVLSFLRFTGELWRQVFPLIGLSWKCILRKGLAGPDWSPLRHHSTRSSPLYAARRRIPSSSGPMMRFRGEIDCKGYGDGEYRRSGTRERGRGTRERGRGDEGTRTSDTSITAVVHFYGAAVLRMRFMTSEVFGPPFTRIQLPLERISATSSSVRPLYPPTVQ